MEMVNREQSQRWPLENEGEEAGGGSGAIPGGDSPRGGTPGVLARPEVEEKFLPEIEGGSASVVDEAPLSSAEREEAQATRRKFDAEQKIRIVLEGLRGAIPITDLCRQEGIAPAVYYKGSKSFLDAGKNDLTHDIKRDATTDEVKALKEENSDRRRAVVEFALDVQRLKKAWASDAKEIPAHECPTKGRVPPPR